MKRENYSFEQGKAHITCINSQLSYLIQQRTTGTPRVLEPLFLRIPVSSLSSCSCSWKADLRKQVC